jgi:hypothetical protein
VVVEGEAVVIVWGAEVVVEGEVVVVVPGVMVGRSLIIWVVESVAP